MHQSFFSQLKLEFSNIFVTFKFKIIVRQKSKTTTSWSKLVHFIQLSFRVPDLFFSNSISVFNSRESISLEPISLPLTAFDGKWKLKLIELLWQHFSFDFDDFFFHFAFCNFVVHGFCRRPNLLPLPSSTPGTKLGSQSSPPWPHRCHFMFHVSSVGTVSL